MKRFGTFGEYMFDLLFAPLKRGKRAVNQFYIFFKVVGRIFDGMKKDVFRVRSEANVASASPVMLPVHGQDRDMPRLEGEDVESYRTRLSMKGVISEWSGTKTGILYALVVLREEQHGHAIVALCRQNLAALLSLFTEKVMRNLEQDASAVAGVLLESRATAVLQVDQNGQRIVQNLVMALTVDIGKRADATCIVVEFGAIKALLLSGICLHRDPPLDIRQSVE